MDQISIGKIDISVDYDRVLEFHNPEKILIEEADRLERKFRSSSVEVFHRKDNILVTEAGYYVTAFTSNLTAYE